MSGGHGKAQRKPMATSLTGFSMSPTSLARPLIILGTARPARSSSQEPPQSSWKLLVAAKLLVASFPWVPWAALMARESARHTYFKHQCNGLWPIEG